MTDPARELGEIAERLTVGSNDNGATFLADKFGVPKWSTEFMQIITCILERCDLVIRIVQNSDLDDDHKEKAIDHLRMLKGAFISGSIVNPWNTSGNGLTIVKEHGGPIHFLSPTVRPVVGYPRLSDEEKSELINAIDVYLTDLQESDEGPDFVRQAIVDGLTQFRFQLEMLGWMGAGYALSAFREVIFCYQQAQAFQASPDFNANGALQGLLGIIKLFKQKIEDVKGWKDTANTAWEIYGAVSKFALPYLATTQISMLPGP